jgi:hypothetical protein
MVTSYLFSEGKEQVPTDGDDCKKYCTTEMPRIEIFVAWKTVAVAEPQDMLVGI